MKIAASLFASAALLAASSAYAAPKLAFQAANPVAQVSGGSRVASGSANGLAWTAWNNIIGMTSTATVAGGGNPLFLAPKPQYNGVVALIMNYGAGGSFICSGTLVNARSIVTAAHCVSDGFGTAGPLTTTAWFNNNLDDVVPNNPNSTGIQVSRIYVNSGYTGEVIDQNDIAVLRLSADAPVWATRYGLDFDDPSYNEEFNVAGYGRRSDTGGNIGANLGTGRLRQGLNNFDYAWGDGQFGGFFTDLDANGRGFFGFADYANSWVSDFDNGLAANDTSCRIAGAVGAAPGFGCNLGVGAREVGVAGGDSGGPQFVNGRLTAVTSYGLSFGTDFGDCRAGLNSSCGEFSGYVPLSIHEQFVMGAIPEPQSWAMLIAGFGIVGASMRRRRQVRVAA